LSDLSALDAVLDGLVVGLDRGLEGVGDDLQQVVHALDAVDAANRECRLLLLRLRLHLAVQGHGPVDGVDVDAGDADAVRR
jgi:hypothetical protein